MRPGVEYHLYLWDETDPRCYECGRLQKKRGRRVKSFAYYKHLVGYAQMCAVAAGYPKSRWSQLFDWNQM